MNSKNLFLWKKNLIQCNTYRIIISSKHFTTTSNSFNNARIFSVLYDGSFDRIKPNEIDKTQIPNIFGSNEYRVFILFFGTKFGSLISLKFCGQINSVCSYDFIKNGVNGLSGKIFLNLFFKKSNKKNLNRLIISNLSTIPTV